MILQILIWVIWAVTATGVAYLFAYALLSLMYRKREFSGGEDLRIITLVPAYHSDLTIMDTARAAAAQSHPRHRVIVISDGMSPETVGALRAIPVEVMEVSFRQSSKARALAEAMGRLGEDEADIVTILDADNIVSREYASTIAGAFAGGCRAVQLHRTARNRDTSTAVTDALSEEINNAIFRKGHVAAGLTSALIGSGMAFGYGWFREAVKGLETAGEDKELELMLLKQGIKVAYIDGETVLDEKTRSDANYSRQRRRWISTQFDCLGRAARSFSSAADHIGMADKMLQWSLPPRMVLLGTLALMTLLCTVLDFSHCLKWWILAIMALATIALAAPKGTSLKDMAGVCLKFPKLAIVAAANMLRLKGASSTFIHTHHDGKQ